MDGAESEVNEATSTSPTAEPPGRVSVIAVLAVVDEAVVDPTLLIDSLPPPVLDTVIRPVLVTVFDPVAFVAVSCTVYVPVAL